MEINILFSCTSLLSDSSLIKDYDYINETLKFYYRNIEGPSFKDLIKNTYLTYKVMNLTEINTMNVFNKFKNKRILEGNQYRVIENSNAKFVRNLDMKTFLMNNKDIKFDIIVFTQCNNLVETILSNEDLRRIRDVYFSKQIIINSMLNLYTSLESKGFIFNFYYELNGDNTSTLCNIEDYYVQTYVTIEYLMYHICIFECFLYLFENIDIGVYQKKEMTGLQLEQLDSIIETTYDLILTKFINNPKNCLLYILNRYFRNNRDIKENAEFITALLHKLKQVLSVN